VTHPFGEPVLGPLDDADPEEGLTIFAHDRCRCFNYCSNRATIGGLCDRCQMEHAALRNAYRGPGEWG
jgi:hypothetical protein